MTEMHTCPICEGEGTIDIIEEMDFAAGGDPHGEPDFYDVVVDTVQCEACVGDGMAYTPFVKCDHCDEYQVSGECEVYEEDGVKYLCCCNCGDSMMEVK